MHDALDRVAEIQHNNGSSGAFVTVYTYESMRQATFTRFMTTQAARSQATHTVMLIASDADENKKGLKPVDFSPFWRKRWDSNPRAREDYLISSQGRYDHFDTLPYRFV